MSALAHYPSLVVELGAAFVLLATLVSRILLARFGIPSIVTLLTFGLAAGPSGLGFLRLNLTDSATRALLSLAVVLVLFEATLRIDLRGISKATIALLTILGASSALLILPIVARAYHVSHLVASMIGAICIVTGPTVVGPLMARLRPRLYLSRILESEGLVLDAIGVVVASAVFATYTSRPGPPLQASWEVTERISAGIFVGATAGLIGRWLSSLSVRAPSDVTKIGLLLIGFSAYAASEWVSHESGLVAVVVCGLMLDFRMLPHERLLRVFKEDLSMLALSTVFVLLASQIQVQRLGPLVAPAAALTGALVVLRVVTVAIATAGSGLNLRERLLAASVFPRGIVAVSLATYYATQIPAWGLHGGRLLAGILFLVIVATITISTPLSMFVARHFQLQMPAVVIAGITPETLELARRYRESGHLPYLVDADEPAVSLARSQDLEATKIELNADLASVVRERRAEILVVDSSRGWDAGRLNGIPRSVTVKTAAAP
jgi:NhaP-type Na+/H+ or K+/H+ antiporter